MGNRAREVRQSNSYSEKILISIFIAWNSPAKKICPPKALAAVKYDLASAAKR